MKSRDIGWLLLLLALSKRRTSSSSSPTWKVPEGPQPEDNWIPPQPVLPDPPK